VAEKSSKRTRKETPESDTHGGQAANRLAREALRSLSAGEILAELGREDDRIVVLTADLKYANRSADFEAVFPNRFFNVGIAEQNLVTVAAGMASCGKLPYVFTFASYLGLMCVEQMRTDCAFTNMPVRFVATHSGMSMGYYGTSHHALEDLGIMRTLANVTVVSVADPTELEAVLRASLSHEGPMYIRLGRGRDPDVYTEPLDDFKLGKAIRLREGSDLTFVTAGSELAPCLEAADLLESRGIHARVVDLHTLVPIDRDEILAAARETEALMTVEEHNAIGGIGSAVADVLVDHGLGIRFKRHGVPNEYVPIGPPAALYAHYELDAPGIAKVAEAFLGAGGSTSRR
jgi:transketolase